MFTGMSSIKIFSARPLDERGSALVGVLVLFLAIATLSGVIMTRGETQAKMDGQTRFNFEARNVTTSIQSELLSRAGCTASLGGLPAPALGGAVPIAQIRNTDLEGKIDPKSPWLYIPGPPVLLPGVMDLRRLNLVQRAGASIPSKYEVEVTFIKLNANAFGSPEARRYIPVDLEISGGGQVTSCTSDPNQTKDRFMETACQGMRLRYDPDQKKCRGCPPEEILQGWQGDGITPVCKDPMRILCESMGEKVAYFDPTVKPKCVICPPSEIVRNISGTPSCAPIFDVASISAALNCASPAVASINQIDGIITGKCVF